VTVQPLLPVQLTPIAPPDMTMPALPAPAVGNAAAPGFGNIVSQGLDAVNQQLLVSQTDLQSMATGNEQSLHHVMIRLEETRLSFQLMMQVRNRLLDAYQDVMKMQV
jgi:flagellar hook-basal body complex protein FliE